MGTTARKALPYPENTDKVMDGAAAVQSLAEAVDQLYVTGVVAVTTTTDGYLSIAHGLGVVPANVQLTPCSHFGNDTILIWKPDETTASNIRLRILDGATNAPPPAGQARSISWAAFR